MTRRVKIGGVTVGGGSPVIVQSMCSTKTKNVAATVAQIKKRLEKAGCEIMRCGVPDMDSARAISTIKKKIKIPLVADIHYDYRLALASIENGADKIRINPGNIGSIDRIEAVIAAAKRNKCAVRIGVNSGSLKETSPFKLSKKSGNGRADRMVASLMDASHFEERGFRDIVISLKASDILTTIAAYKLAAQYTDCPAHIGITEAGTELGGIIKSSVGLGILLHDGIGDTMRVSLTAEPERKLRGVPHLKRARNKEARRGHHIVPHLRSHRDRRDKARAQGGGAHNEPGKTAENSRHGMFRERAGRGQRGGHRRGGRPRHRAHIQKRRHRKKGPEKEPNEGIPERTRQDVGQIKFFKRSF